MTNLIDNVLAVTGYRFKSSELLRTALTHRSAEGDNNERLEFLGDSVLGMLIAIYLFKKYPECDEGTLTRGRASVVRQESLATVARRINLGRFIVLGEAAIRSGGGDRESILADVLEAVLGAVFLDGGLESASTVVDRLFEDELRLLNPLDVIKDPKTDLQEILQGMGRPLPVYEVVEQKGPAHQREFVVMCHIQDPIKTYSGRGSSRRRAEQVAAKSAIHKIRIDHSEDS